MKRFSAIGLCLIAAIVIPTAATASASLPEFSGPFPKPFKATSGVVHVETVGHTKAICKAGTNVGEATGPKTGTATLRLTGCEALGLVCTTEGAAAGEIVSNPLTTTLGYIDQAKKEVGLSTEAASGGTISEFKCGGISVKESGSIIGRITPVDKQVKAGEPFKLKLKQAKGKQKPSAFEGGPTDVLMVSVATVPPEEAGVSDNIDVTFSEAGEIKA
jgi:hypothetical protein